MPPIASFRRPLSGFTLLEMLVVLAILGFLGVASFNLASSGVRLQQSMEAHSEGLETSVRFWQWVERDMEQITPRQIRDALGEPQSALLLTDNQLAFTKLGWQNPLGFARSDVQRVEYEWRNDRLIRRFWPVLDRDQDTQSIEQVFTDITEVQVALLINGEWQNEWRSRIQSELAFEESASENWPEAIRYRLTLQGLGKVERLFLLPTQPSQWVEE